MHAGDGLICGSVFDVLEAVANISASFTGPETPTQHPGDKLWRLPGAAGWSHSYCKNCIRGTTNPEGE